MRLASLSALSGLFIGFFVKRVVRKMPELDEHMKESSANLVALREMTEHLVDVEQERERAFALLNGINRVLLEALTCEDDVAVAGICLTVAEELTDSKFGFISLLNEAGLSDTIAISDPGYDACKIPGSEIVTLLKDMPLRGVDRGTLRDDESRIVNDPVSHPNHSDPPKGHPTITSFLGVPLRRADKTIGMIGLANKESGYELADQEDIEALSSTFMEALVSKQMEMKLRNGSPQYLC